MSEQTQPAADWRNTWAKIAQGSVLTTVLAVVIALVIGAVLIAAVDKDVQATAAYLGYRPGDFFTAVWDSIANAYSALFQGAVLKVERAQSFGDAISPLATTISMSTPLIFAGLGLGIGFRAGLFNIGAQGQIVLGGVLCGFLGFAFHLPTGLHLMLCIVGAFVGGACWGFIPGILKAKTGANEVIVTIMLNSIAVFFVGWLLTLESFRKPGSNNPVSPPVDETARFPHLFNTPIDLGFALSIAAAFGVWWLMERSTLGFRIRAVGANSDAARTAGMNVSASFVWVMVLAGGLAGLAATSQLLSSGDQQLSENVAGSFGFDAITVALLGRSSPRGTVFAGLLFGGLRAGGYLMQSATGTPIDVILVLQSVIVLLIAAPPLVRAIFRLPDPQRRKRTWRAAKLEVTR